MQQQHYAQTDGPVWWKEHIVYQVYPRSFKDTSGNGIGDLRGIIEKLDYIASLGVTALWINPIYASPNDDNGYDISDYRAILPEFGTMADFDALMAGLKARNIEFIMDLVVNHSSDEHPWFVQSRSSRDNPYRDYYHWWPAEKGTPPFRHSFFDEQGSAWQYDAQTDAYYLHYFSTKQPDLNWENPKVRAEVYDIMRFWLAKGVNGFRLDAFQFVSKDTTFPEFPKGYEKSPVTVIKHHGMGPHLHAYLQEMYREVLSQHATYAVIEGAGSSLQDAHDLVDAERNELQMVYHFEAVDMGKESELGHTLADFKRIHTMWDHAFAEKGWLSIFLANHDVPRMVSQFGDDRPAFRAKSAELLNTFLLTMRGTPYCYYGDELGMTNIGFENISQYQDIAAINGYKKALANGEDMTAYMQKLQKLSRDNSRTPMQWDNSENAGFSTAQPWLTVNKNYTSLNVALQQQDPKSTLQHFRTLTALRKAHTPVLVYGAYQLLQAEHPTVYAYSRSSDTQQFCIVLNFADTAAEITLDILKAEAKVLVNNYPSLEWCSAQSLRLAPYQAVVLAV